jgi:hypothetical protein
MRGYVSTFWLPKQCAAPEEYEDAWAVRAAGRDARGEDLRIIIADGASESMLARRWASRLVVTFAEAAEDLGTSPGFAATHQRAVGTWEAEVARYKRERADRNSPIQWYEEPGLARGAYSTLLAVDFRWGVDRELVGWTAAAIGDSCLFQVRGGELIGCFPMLRSEDFGNQPALLSSNAVDAEVLARSIVTAAGDLEREDVFFLATDALSAWFLRAVEAGDEPWRTLEVLVESAPDEFAELIGKLRDDRAIRDDDTTLVRVDFR